MDAPEMVKVLEVKEETPSVSTIVLEKKVKAKYGQFFMLWIPDVGEKPYTFSRLDDNLEITVKRVGPFSEKMCSLKKGDLIGIRGPYGGGYFNLTGKDICIIAGGVGIAPLMPLIENQRESERERNFTVIFGANTKDELLFVDRIKKTDVELIITTDDGSAGEKCPCHEVLSRITKKRRFDQILCCGPEPMMKEILEIAIKEKIPCQLSLERYMKCGIGICGSCSLDPSGLLVCKDGPVFSAEKLINSEFGKYRRDASGSRAYLRYKAKCQNW
ncbi:MAG TPA: dihydroorotate dehydrogenase electron transfer subunit [Candidatus Altiarchaeales archaeon]|nr:dihydroorotate dehydrogenase electron transfer subunit [Candidatus Altiarchaeales archaeon]